MCARIVFSFILYASSCFGAEKAVVELAKIQPERLVKTVNLIGRVKSDHQTTIKADINGRVETITTVPGAFVKKGTLLIKFESDSQQKQYDLSKSKEKYSQRNYTRFKGLLDANHVSQSEKESAKERLLSDRIDLEKAKSSLNDTVYTAPFDGVCGIFKVAPGSNVRIGEILVEFYDITNLHIYVEVPESILENLKEGQKALVKDSYEGKIFAIQRCLDETTHMGAIKIQASLSQLNIGAFIPVRLEATIKEDALGLPQEAIFVEAGKTFVYVVKDNKAHTREVEIGFRSDTKFEIKSGLSAGEIVVIRGHNRLYDGCTVSENGTHL